MNKKSRKIANPKVSFSAKIPKEIKDKIKEIAVEQERTPSQVLSRLLSSHPEIAGKTGHLALSK